MTSLIPPIYPHFMPYLQPDYRIVLAEILGDYLFRCPNQFVANQLASIGTPVFLYEFSLATRTPSFPCCDGLACHTCELPYVFEQLGIIKSDYSWASVFNSLSGTQSPSSQPTAHPSNQQQPSSQPPTSRRDICSTTFSTRIPNHQPTTQQSNNTGRIESTGGTGGTSTPSTPSKRKNLLSNVLDGASSWISSLRPNSRSNSPLDSNNNMNNNQYQGKVKNETVAGSNGAPDTKQQQRRHQSTSTSSSPSSHKRWLIDALVARLMADYWTNFAKYGDPNGLPSLGSNGYEPGTRPPSNDAPWWPQIRGELHSREAILAMQAAASKRAIQSQLRSATYDRFEGLLYEGINDDYRYDNLIKEEDEQAKSNRRFQLRFGDEQDDREALLYEEEEELDYEQWLAQQQQQQQQQQQGNRNDESGSVSSSSPTRSTIDVSNTGDTLASGSSTGNTGSSSSGTSTDSSTNRLNTNPTPNRSLEPTIELMEDDEDDHNDHHYHRHDDDDDQENDDDDLTDDRFYDDGLSTGINVRNTDSNSRRKDRSGRGVARYQFLPSISSLLPPLTTTSTHPSRFKFISSSYHDVHDTHNTLPHTHTLPYTYIHTHTLPHPHTTIHSSSNHRKRSTGEYTIGHRSSR